MTYIRKMSTGFYLNSGAVGAHKKVSAICILLFGQVSLQSCRSQPEYNRFLNLPAQVTTFDPNPLPLYGVRQDAGGGKVSPYPSSERKSRDQSGTVRQGFHCSVDRLDEFEKGLRDPKLNAMADIANALNCRLRDIIGDAKI